MKPQIPVKSATDAKHLRANSATRAPAAAKYTLTKSLSADELRKKNQQALVDEKKRKLEEKMKQAQLLREAKDREREEKLKKIFVVSFF